MSTAASPTSSLRYQDDATWQEFEVSSDAVMEAMDIYACCQPDERSMQLDWSQCKVVTAPSRYGGLDKFTRSNDRQKTKSASLLFFMQGPPETIMTSHRVITRRRADNE